MTKILDWKKAEDPRDVIHLAVQALAEGHLVAFPSQAHYVVAASGLKGNAAQALQEILGATATGANKDQRGSGLASLVLRSANELCDYVPGISSLGLRLANRLWPGPIELRFATQHPHSLVRQLPQATQTMVRDSRGYLGFIAADHPAFAEVMRLSSGPLLIGSPPTSTTETLMTNPGELPSKVVLAIDDGLTQSPSPSTVIRIDGARCQVERQGKLSAEELVSSSQFKLLFVCTGNTCRSPMAEQLMKAKLKQRFPEHLANRQLPPIEVASAGVAAYPGGPASDGAIAAMARLGLDLSRHESQATTVELVERADLILTMTNSHRLNLLSRWPQLARKTHLLAGEHGDVSDPFGGSIDTYQACAKKIDQYLEAWLDHLDQETLPIWSVEVNEG